jgi:RNA-directed DNA polymerase
LEGNISHVVKATNLEELFEGLSYFFNQLLLEDEINPVSLDSFIEIHGNTLREYNYFEIPKKSGGYREISAPSQSLKLIQRAISDVLTELYSPLPCVHGFVPYRNIVTNASLHTNKKYILNVDIQDFFPNTAYASIIKVLKVAPFSFHDVVAKAIARFACLNGGLPQGSPLSPILTNMYCVTLDNQLSELAKSYKLHYSRYADDLTFSGSKPVFNKRFFSALNKIVRNSGYQLKQSKTRIQSKNMRQEVTGLVVNDKINVNRHYIRELRAMIHLSQKRYNPNLYEKIEGKLAFLSMVKGKDQVYRNLNSKFKAISHGRPIN